MALEIQIGADNSDLKKKIQEAEFDIKQLAKLKIDRIKLGLDTKDLDNNIKDVKKSLADLKNVNKDAGNSFGSLVPKVANGGNALMQFSRIAQDAPFGIMGIGNNITATTEAFGYLKTQTGSTGGALKAMASSLMGSGGILLAVSLVTSALTYMAQNGLTVSDVLDKMTGNFDNLKKSMDSVNNEAQKNAGAEISSMNALISISKDENNTRQERLSAVQKLQEEYPAYFGNLTKEQILNGNVEAATRAVAFALIQKAKATILANKIGENELKILELQQQGQKEIADFVSGKGLYAILKGINGQQAFKASTDSTSKSIDNLKKEQALFTQELEKSTKAANTFEIANKKASETPKKNKVIGSTPQVSGLGSTITPSGLAETSGKVLEIAKNVKGAEGMITTSMGKIQQSFDTSGLYMLEALQSFNDQASNIINDSIASTFADLGTAIGSALASGGNVMKAAGKALLGSVGALLTNLGTMAIQVGVGLLGIKAALKTLNPAIAIAAGVALVTLGAVFSSKASSLGNSVGSGNNQSVSTGSSVSSPIASTGTSSSGGFSGGTVVFEISGQSLIGVLSNTLDRNKRLGGSISLG